MRALYWRGQWVTEVPAQLWDWDVLKIQARELRHGADSCWYCGERFKPLEVGLSEGGNRRSHVMCSSAADEW